MNKTEKDINEALNFVQSIFSLYLSNGKVKKETFNKLLAALSQLKGFLYDVCKTYSLVERFEVLTYLTGFNPVILSYPSKAFIKLGIDKINSSEAASIVIDNIFSNESDINIQPDAIVDMKKSYNYLEGYLLWLSNSVLQEKHYQKCTDALNLYHSFINYFIKESQPVYRAQILLKSLGLPVSVLTTCSPQILADLVQRQVILTKENCTAELLISKANIIGKSFTNKLIIKYNYPKIDLKNLSIESNFIDKTYCLN